MKERLEELFNTDYLRMVMRISPRVGGRSNAEDVVQESFCRALKYSNTYREGEDFKSWFNTLLNNCSRDFKKQERLDGMADEEEEAGPSMQDTQEKLWLAEMIQQEIATRPPVKATILKGYFLQEYKPREIEEFSPLKGPYIRKIIQRFREEMQEKYGADLRS